jgi:hypothetical protein
MLTEFEQNEAKALRESIKQTVYQFVLNPSIAKDIAKLENLEQQCNHIYKDGVCVYCGKEE